VNFTFFTLPTLRFIHSLRYRNYKKLIKTDNKLTEKLALLAL